MKLMFEKEEIVELTDIVKALRNPKVTMVWNAIFGPNHAPEIQVEVADKISVTIDKNISLPMLLELKRHGSSFGGLLQSGFSLNMLSRWKRAWNELSGDMKAMFHKIRKN